MAEEGVVRSATDGGTAGAHPAVPNLEVLAGPSTADERNSIKTAVIPVACWKVDDVRFEFDSSFVRPEIAEEMKSLAELRDEHKKEVKLSPTDEAPVVIHPPLSIFGHADPTGNDDYNKGLSGRRATAVYGLLTRDAALWEELYSKPEGGDKWGVKAIQVMLAHLGFSGGGATGQTDARTRESVKKFQKVKGLTADGDPGPQTRRVLFLAYMDALCGADFVLNKRDDFLGRGADAGGKGDYQGCSEFNPALLLSKEEESEFKKAGRREERDAANAPNRRVMVLLFRPGSRVSVENWPCPRAKEGVAGCKKRFWSDGEKRRGTRLTDGRRKYGGAEDTFACRFYDRMVNSSPCERALKIHHIRLYDPAGEYIAHAPYEIIIESQDPLTKKIIKRAIHDTASEYGIVTMRDIRIPSTCFIRWGYKPEPGESRELVFSLNMHLDVEREGGERKETEEGGKEEKARKKLNNLGYYDDDPKENVRSFQRHYGHLVEPNLLPTGQLDERTFKVLTKIYRDCEHDLKDTKVD